MGRAEPNRTRPSPRKASCQAVTRNPIALWADPLVLSLGEAAPNRSVYSRATRSGVPLRRLSLIAWMHAIVLKFSST